jgi:hypothetical protein
VKRLLIILLLSLQSFPVLAQREPDSFLTIFQAGIPSNADFFEVLTNQDYLRQSGSHVRRFEGAIPLLQFYANRLNSAQLPTAYAVIPIIESGNLPTAISPVGAVGVWQLMPATARRYGLRVDPYEDERYQINPSSDAAVKYLKYLHGLFNHPIHILAAYNWGEQNVIQLRKKTKSHQEFMRHPQLPLETKQYINRVYAFWFNIYQLNYQHALHRYPNVTYFEIDISRQLDFTQEQMVYQFVNPVLNRNRDRLMPTEHFFKYFQGNIEQQKNPSRVKESRACLPSFTQDFHVYVVKAGDTHQKIIHQFKLRRTEQQQAVKKMNIQPVLIIKIPFESDPAYQTKGLC